MKHMGRTDCIFTKECVADSIRIWNSAAISLIDIRHNLISPKDAIFHYRLPASAFLYTSGVKAEVLLNDTSYAVERFGLFHGGRGTELSIHPQEGWLEYYMVLYKAGEPPFHKREFLRLMEHTNPFRQQYGFAPQNPLFFMEQLRKMYERWKGPTPLNLFYGKSAFYPLVYEVYEALQQDNVCVFEPDIITIAQRFLDKHFGEPVSIQDLCAMLGISYSSFYRNFKQKAGVTPQEYLIDARLTAARKWLQSSDASIREVAEHCGFPDEHNFYRQFTKSVGTSPNAYRQISQSRLKDNTIGNVVSFPYNWDDLVSQNELKEKGATSMLKQMGSKAVLAAALSLVLMLSACSSAPANTSGTESSSSAAVSSQVIKTEGTRILKTVKGDVEIPASPKRIVTDYGLLGNVIALGVTPIAIENYGAEDVSFKDQIEEVSILEKWEPEFIMAEEPDLILTVYEDSYEQLSKIAPTVYVPVNDMTVLEKLTFLADALGKDPDEGKQVVDAFYAKVDAAKEKLRAAGFYDKTFSVIRIQGENKIGVRWSNNLGGQILFGALGLPYSEGAVKEIKSGQDWGATLSFEALPEYMGDYILVTASDEFSYGLIENSPIWKSLPAVQAGNILVFSEPYMYLNDIYSWSAQLDLITDALLKKTP